MTSETLLCIYLFLPLLVIHVAVLIMLVDTRRRVKRLEAQEDNGSSDEPPASEPPVAPPTAPEIPVTPPITPPVATPPTEPNISTPPPPPTETT